MYLKMKEKHYFTGCTWSWKKHLLPSDLPIPLSVQKIQTAFK